MVVVITNGMGVAIGIASLQHPPLKKHDRYLDLKPHALTHGFMNKKSISATQSELTADRRDAAWRAAFKPHAYLLGTHTRPSSITIFGISGGAKRWLNIPLDLEQPPVTFATQALGFVRQTPVVPFFGPTTGFVINYTPDRAVRFDLEGNPVECFPCAYFPGDVTLTLGNRKMAADEFARIAGLRRTDEGVTNASNEIFPDKDNGVWVFNDPNDGLAREPFVAAQ